VLGVGVTQTAESLARLETQDCLAELKGAPLCPTLITPLAISREGAELSEEAKSELETETEFGTQTEFESTETGAETGAETLFVLDVVLDDNVLNAKIEFVDDSSVTATIKGVKSSDTTSKDKTT